MLTLWQVIFTLYGSFVFAGVHYGMGKHNNSQPQDREIQALKVSFISNARNGTSHTKPKQYQALSTAIYIANMAFIKLSIAVFLLRIAVQRRYQLILKSAWPLWQSELQACSCSTSSNASRWSSNGIIQLKTGHAYQATVW
jgi:hypothetical protein